MKFVVLYIDNDECNNVIHSVKEIQTMYNGSVLMHHNVYNKDNANICFKTNIYKLPVLLLYPKYYHTPYNVFDSDEHYIYYLNNNNDDLINFVKDKAKLSKEYRDKLDQIKDVIINNDNKYNKKDIIDDITDIINHSNF
jgi:hypothetical protein